MEKYIDLGTSQEGILPNVLLPGPPEDSEECGSGEIVKVCISSGQDLISGLLHWRNF